MLSILVLGYYDRYNLGDDCFKEVIPFFFKSHNLIFKCIDDIPVENDIYKYDAVVCGGGDIINNYFIKKLKKILKGYNKNIFAFGVGIPFRNTIKENYLEIFDHMFIRNKTDLLLLQKYYGSKYIHYLPDIVYSIKLPKLTQKKELIQNRKKEVGIFLIQSIYKYKPLVYSLIRFIEYLLDDHNVTLYSFNTSGSDLEDDSFINSDIHESLLIHHDNIKLDNNRYNSQEMLQIMNLKDINVCMRFHSHIFSVLAETPFFSIYTTRKVKQFIDEDQYKWSYEVELDGNCKPIKMDYLQLIENFKNVSTDYNQILKKIRYMKNFYRNLLETDQVNNLINFLDKRNSVCDISTKINVKEIYKKVRDKLITLTNYNPDCKEPPENNLDKDKSQIVSQYMCMLITNMPSSQYVYGTTNNIITKPHKLLEMIKWISDDFISKYNSNRKCLDLTYINQNEFKGLHRAGWQYVINYIKGLNTKNGVLLDLYLDRTFHWGKNIMLEMGILPYTTPWVGFMHHTPDENYTKYNTTAILKDHTFIKSLVTCQGIYTLSNYLANWLRNELKTLGYENINVNVLYHPTLFPKTLFNPENFKNNDIHKLINVGAWYRNPFYIYSIDTSTNNKIQKCSLKGKDMNNYFKPDKIVITRENIQNNLSQNKWEYFLKEYIKNVYNPSYSGDIPENFEITIESFVDNSPSIVEEEEGYVYDLIQHLKELYNNVNILDYLNNDEYDKIFSENIVFLNLINCSAANTIIECIVRNTPIVINRLEPVEEYLGKDYPLFYEKSQDIPGILTEEKILEAHEYLKHKDKEFLQIEYFMFEMEKSSIYQNILKNSN